MNESEIFQLERPSRALFKLYLARVVLFGPLIIVTLPLLWFRYLTLRYSFDSQGIHMRWGVLFRREVNLTYARIQDIHVRSGVIQRWLGLGDLPIQTASGSSGPEMTIEGFHEFTDIRNFLYERMRGTRRGASSPKPPQMTAQPASDVGSSPEVVDALTAIRDELRSMRRLLENRKD